ncbi:MAG: hypothetical protein H0V19_06350 [Euzebyales bacterium]|nr:hypothetical protein [Euzebyales bacterium]
MVGLRVSAPVAVPPLHTYVLARDDNVVGVRAPASPVRGRVDFPDDVDDVLRFRLRRGETLRAGLVLLAGSPARLDMYLFGPSTTDVTDLRQEPLFEKTRALAADPLRLRATARSTGPHFLDVLGKATYRLGWSIWSPGVVSDLTVSNDPFTPNGDGRADRTRVSWDLRRRGEVVLRIRDGDGRLVRHVDYGREPEGRESFSWNGRDQDGRKVAGGRYRVRLAWRDGEGRLSRSGVRVTVRR